MKRNTTTAAVALLTLLAGSVAQAIESSPSSRAPAVAAADHLLELSGARVRVESTWVLSQPLAAGERVELARPLLVGSALHSEGFQPMKDARGAIVALSARHALAAGVHRLQLSTPLAQARTQLPMPHSPCVNRVRLERSLRFEPTAGAGLRHRMGILVADDIEQAARRQADRLLDGRHAHRRLGAIYVRGGALKGTLESSKTHHGQALLFIGGLFVLISAGLGLAYRRLTRAVDGERVDLFLEQELGADLHALEKKS
ncbi:MAG: hypothetical protein OEZ06_10970 [Myxococcales bacterium]|nr:hypothetical protein [Myxococcales bacterium]